VFIFDIGMAEIEEYAREPSSVAIAASKHQQ
jgi:hypothetical protein